MVLQLPPSQNHAKSSRVEWVPVPARCFHWVAVMSPLLTQLVRKNNRA
jgi:hypothetical protein